ncbi:hypothetical protein PGRAN_06021 [Listeria grandensis FSL F6-0971]|uniref:DUF1963 domain-containing protein n=1 Tax=Listeria grandensis FSL F6-0971 TaxID=1265819 RepID=W7B9A2_9LIST|nr:YwqG family protein [Listeria grandensis]EUJ23894.1 hypothetical protein PGRAN_06021 [Listeria grandensis FSL F6-0971]
MSKQKLEEIVPQEALPQFLATEKSRILLSFKDEGELGLMQSKAGGRAYLPKSEPYPRNGDGQPLSLLAQINFEEMPALDNFPTRGLLSFYVDYNDDIIGIDFDEPTNTNGFRVFYFEDFSEVSYSKEEQDALFESVDKDDFYPVVEGEFWMYGQENSQLLLTDSYDFKKVFGGDFYEVAEKLVGEDDDKLDELFELAEVGSQLGAYPYFTQEDPRKYQEGVRHDTLLFQLDSVGIDTFNYGIIWGDCGIGNFFINLEDLKNKDFSNVMYNWDCT